MTDEDRQTLGTRDNATTARGDIDTGDGLVVAFQLILQLEGISDFTVQFDGRVLGHSQCLAISREGVVSDWAVEEVVNFGGSHVCYPFSLSSTVYLFFSSSIGIQ